jgi:calcineurin-like phosphoesterase family protein
MGQMKVNLDIKKVLFAADLHADHRNIIRYCARPWDHVEEMFEQLVSNWNRRAKPDSIIYMIGDMFIDTRTEQILDRLKRFHGQIKLVPGNHDTAIVELLRSKTAPSGSWGGRLFWEDGSIELMPAMLELHGADYPRPLCLCHYAMERWHRGHDAAWHLHGHTHPKIVRDEQGVLREVDLKNGLAQIKNRLNLCFDVVHYGKAPQLWAPLTWAEVNQQMTEHNARVEVASLWRSRLEAEGGAGS